MSQVNASSVHVKERVEKSSSKLIGWIKYIFFLLFVFFIFHNVIGISKVSGLSMSPSLEDGGLIIVNKAAKYYKKPHLGDVAILTQPTEGIDIVKRIIGVAGDKVKIQEGIVFVNNEAIPEVATLGKSVDMEEVTVPDGTLFVMGDNRTPGESLDSRDNSVGPISINNLKGYVLYSLSPFHSIPKPLVLE
ncbi:signal peptidase I [Bacillus sp. JJ664]